jgi:UDP-N-acetylglucosamine 4-epimerase
MPRIDQVREQLRSQPKTWLVTGAAGFIGSNLLEHLLKLGQQVIGFDDLSTGHERNLAEVQSAVSAEQWGRFKFVTGDIRNLEACRNVCAGVDFVLHHAALGSVPASIKEPLLTNAINNEGTLNMLEAAAKARVKRFVFASSSAVYGDQPGETMVEDKIGCPLSPYAATKRMNETCAEVYARVQGLTFNGLRYFNVFGPRQDPNGAYAAVIPKWIAALLENEPVEIFGDGETTRDFCYVENVVQANLLAATATDAGAVNQIFNIACGESTSLNQLFATLRDALAKHDPSIAGVKPAYRDFRTGDVRRSRADIARARERLGYAPMHSAAQGLQAALDWYRAHQ